MKCPACSNELKPTNYEGQDIDLCPKCSGIWFDKGELFNVIDSLLSKNEIDPQTVKEAYRDKITSQDKIKQLKRKCPECSIDMRLVNYSYDSNIIIDKCPSCNGIWTDAGEMRAVAKYIKGSAEMNSYSTVLIDNLGKHQESGDNKSKISAVIISLSYLILSFLGGGLNNFFYMLMFLILPLGCILFGDELGNITGVRFKTTMFAPVITRPTPGVFVVIAGWILLLLPIIFPILSAIGLFNLSRPIQ